MRSRPVILLWFGLTTGLGPQAAAADDHTEQASNFVAELAEGAFAQLSASDVAEAEKRAAVAVLLNDALAVDGIARFALGRHWQRTSPQQQQEYLHVFRDFIIRGSVDRMMRYSGQTFEIVGVLAGTAVIERHELCLRGTENQ